MEIIILVLVIIAVVYFLSRDRSSPGKDAVVATKAAGKGPKTYFSPIVGESNYQRVIKRLDIGDDVEIVRERDNPYDADALCVRTLEDETIGYIARDSWLRAALGSEGKGCQAWIDHIGVAEGRTKGVRLGLVLTKEPLEERDYVGK
ncbi:HIRAN domain-containing protein [Qipengyuania sp. SM2507]